jgi:hypothetical protein
MDTSQWILAVATILGGVDLHSNFRVTVRLTKSNPNDATAGRVEPRLKQRALLAEFGGIET